MAKNPHPPSELYNFNAWEAVDALRQEDPKKAVHYAHIAYENAPNESEQGRMARDIANGLSKQDRHDEAIDWAERAIHSHDTLVQNTLEERTAWRERGASHLMLARIALRRHLAQPTPDTPPAVATTNFQNGFDDLQMACAQANGLNRWIDQYDINFTAQAATATALAGQPFRAVGTAGHAALLGTFSESRLLDTTNPNLTTRDRLRAKKNALGRAGVALAVSGLMAIKATTPAHKLARKIV